MPVLAKIRNLPLLRLLCAKKAVTKNALVREPNEVLVDIFAYLDYVSIYALAWGCSPFAYFICAADQQQLLPRPREMTLTLRGGSRKSISLASNGSEKATMKIREAWKARRSRNVARSVAAATRKVLKRRGQQPVTNLELLNVSTSNFAELLETCPALKIVEHLTLRSFSNDGRFLEFARRVDYEKLFGATSLRTLRHLEVCDGIPFPYHDVIVDYLFDFTRMHKHEKFIRIVGTTFGGAFERKLTTRLSLAKETIAFVSVAVPCNRILDNTDKLNDVFVKERSQVTRVVKPNGLKITTIRRGYSFIVTNDVEWLQKKLPGLSFAL